MTNAKRITITTESREIFIVRFNDRSKIRGFCEICEAETEMINLDAAVNISRLGAREIIRRIGTDAIHSTETADGHLFVCTESLQGIWETK